jgi:hypothetical protein
MYIVRVAESVIQYKKFLEEVSKHDIVIQSIGTDHTVHSAVSIPSLVFVKDIYTKKTYCFSFKHPDLKPVVDILTFTKDINNLSFPKWAINKKSVYQMLHIKGLRDIDLFLHLRDGKILDYDSYETTAHKFIYRIHRGTKNLNNVIPLLKHQEMFNDIFQFLLDGEVFGTEPDEGYLKENSVILETLADLEMNGIYVNEQCFRKYHEATIYPGNKVFSQYNLYTATGRPSNRFESVNYAALNKEDGIRKCFTSRYGIDGKMVLIDYSAFHPRIICNLIDFELSIDVDIYKYLGELYLGREVTEYDTDEIKAITMKQFYGRVNDEYKHIKYLVHAREFIDDNWKFFEKCGYVLTPLFKRKITNQHCVDANPTKLFNYILQATEGEVAIQALRQVNQYLIGRKTKAVLYTYDSILFDFHKEDGVVVLGDIMEIMKLGNRFPIKVYAGDSYDMVAQIYP